MYFLIIGMDRPGSDLRNRLRTEHLEFVSDKQHLFKFGGPIIDDEDRVIGSLTIMDLPDRAALDAYMQQDPYFRDGLYETLTIRRTRWIVPEESPGALAAELARQKAMTQ